MKNKTLLLITILITAVSFAQQGINYKALIKDDLGNVLVGETIDVKFTIIDDAEPTDVYQETHFNVTTSANGIVILIIGTGTPDLNLFTDVDWSKTNSLKVEIDREQDATFEFMNTTQFMAVPYAKHAEIADNAATKIDDLSDGKTSSSGSSLFIGIDAGLNDSDGINGNNVGIGFEALYENIANNNTANGYQALRNNTIGRSNTANGHQTLLSNTEGDFNTATGSLALLDNITGTSNSAYGYNALGNNAFGNNNIAIGFDALKSNISGNGNIAIGVNAGGNNLGNNNIFIGNQSAASASPLISDRLFIGSLIFGDSNTQYVRVFGDLDVDAEINRKATGNANMVPIAYGTVDSNGNIETGTGNFSAFLSGNVFIIDVSSESLSYGNTVCLITPISTTARTSSTIITDGNGDGDSDLNVRIFNASGTQVLTTFQFVIYKL